LLSPSTGIIDSHAYMLALRGDIENAGGVLVFRTPLLRARATADGFELDTGGDSPVSIGCRIFVNSAGLSAPSVARAIDSMPAEKIPTAYYAKGNYFSCSTRAPFSRLIYPVPEPGGLGVHLTIDMGGQAKFGPDVEWVDTLDYTVDPQRAEKFYPAIRRYWPALPDGALAPSYAGIRPKIVPPAIARQDFLIQSEAQHGVAGLINLFGIESPGLTASLAIASHVADLTKLTP
jgi:L-2-hydroxyglutarate oxidase LhgO